MAGAGKRRAKLEANASSSGEPSSSERKHEQQKSSPQSQSQSPGVQRSSPGHSSAPRSSPASVPRWDGNADPQHPSATFEVTSRNVHDSLGMAAWYAVRGVSQSSLRLSNPTVPCPCRTPLSLARMHASYAQPKRFHPLPATCMGLQCLHAPLIPSSTVPTWRRGTNDSGARV